LGQGRQDLEKPTGEETGYFPRRFANILREYFPRITHGLHPGTAELTGSRPLIMVGAALLVLNPHKQLLMLKRTDNGCWGIPGGVMELGETLEETVKRETKEEIGIEVAEIELFEVYSGPALYYQYPNGAQVYNVSVVYLTRTIGDVIQVNPDEHSEYQYFDVHNLPAEISPPIQPVMRDLVSKILQAGNGA
jgi:8-oxo-dGTP pyrophosphatase MutT (NUDIX family)